MTRKDYQTVQTALGEALRDIKDLAQNHPNIIDTSESVFWFTAEVLALRLMSANPAFDPEQFKQTILEVSEGATK